MPAGFYRVYVQRDGTHAWHDLLLYRSIDQLPAELQDTVKGW